MKKLIVLLACVFASCGQIYAQGAFAPPGSATKTINGRLAPAGSATITVCAAGATGTPCSPVLTNALFSDAALTQPITNPFTSDASGNYSFAAVQGNYTVTVTGTNLPGYSYQVSLSGGITGSVTNCTTSGGVAFQNGSSNTLTCSGLLTWNSLTNILAVNGNIQPTSLSANFSAGNTGSVYSITSAGTAVGNLTTYAATVPTGGTPLNGQNITIAGFVTHTSNNGTFVVQASNLTSITVYNSSGIAETHAATGTMDSVYLGANGFYGYSFSNASTATFPIQGTSYAPVNQLSSTPYTPAFVSVAKGDAKDAAYWREVNDGSTGNHGLEIGAIIDGTGATPITLQLGHFNGVNGVNLNGLPILIAASFTTTAATSDNVTVNGMTSSGHCSLTPTNATASGLAAIPYVSAKTTNQITVTHSVTANGNFDVLCTPY